MFITCQECDTIYRLDEHLLKPGGSKVRCSQCKHVFTAFPAVPSEAGEPNRDFMQADRTPVEKVKPAIDQESEGLDLAQLDAILEQELSARRDEGMLKAAQQSENMPVATNQPDESDLDLDFDLESDESPLLAADAPGADKAEIADSLDLDMAFELDDAPVSGSAAAEETDVTQGDTDSDELEIDFDIDEDQPQQMAQGEAGDYQTAADSDFTELDFDLDSEFSAQDPGYKEPASAETDNLAFDKLEIDFEGAEEAVNGTSEGHANEEIGLLLGDLDQESAPSGASAGLTDRDKAAEDNLDFNFDLDTEPEKALVSDTEEEPELFLDDDPVPRLDEEFLSVEKDLSKELNQEETAKLEAAGKGMDDLNLSELDAVLGVKPQPSPGLPAKEKVSGDEEEVEDLEFKLDAEYEDKPIYRESPAAAKSGTSSDAEDEEDLDLSDLEQMLEKEGNQPDAESVEDFSATASLETEDKRGQNKSEFEAELDLSEIEEAINKADTMPRPDDSDREGELELDLALDANIPHTGDDLSLEIDLEDRQPGSQMQQTAKADDEADNLQIDFELDDTPAPAKTSQNELDLADLGDLDSDHMVTKSGTMEAGGGIALEFQLEEEIAETGPARATTPTPGGKLERSFESEEGFASDKPTVPAAVKAAAKPKKGTSKILIVLLILLLLGAGGYFGFNYLMSSGIEIPYLNQYLNPQPQDPQGILSLSTIDINSKFIENGADGRLFVISGNVLNRYPTARGMIRLEGKLFTKGKSLAKTENVYAGKIISDQDLTTTAVAEIKQQLTAPPKAQDANSKVLPGQSLPFMLVFSDLPDNLDEFAVELIGSVQAQ